MRHSAEYLSTNTEGDFQMARGSSTTNQRLVPQAYHALNQFKYEVATELNINPEYKTGYWGNISSRECGAVGGHMVRRMIAAAEQALIDQQGGGLQAGFRFNPQQFNGQTQQAQPTQTY